jgi:hypothetical protein
LCRLLFHQQALQALQRCRRVPQDLLKPSSQQLCLVLWLLLLLLLLQLWLKQTH